jgi:Holliday junction resolvase RusA-like endonuclease
MTVSFTVHGKPEPAGSKRGFVRGGRVVVTDANVKSRPWKALVTDAAIQAMTVRHSSFDVEFDSLREPLEGPLSVQFLFHVARPKGHQGAKGLRPSAPPYPITRPDLLKLARGVEDALTGIVYHDDSQIIEEVLVKGYGRPGVHITVEQLDEDHASKETAT